MTQLADAQWTSPVSVSQQPMRLRAEGIVQTHRKGKSVFYHVARE